MKPSSGASALVVLDAENRIDQDLSCINADCGYNLRQCKTDGQCPECGRAVVDSLHPDMLRFADRPWLRGVTRGVAWMIAGWIVAFVWFVLVYRFEQGRPLSEWIYALPAVLLVAWLAAVFIRRKVTSPVQRQRVGLTAALVVLIVGVMEMNHPIFTSFGLVRDAPFITIAIIKLIGAWLITSPQPMHHETPAMRRVRQITLVAWMFTLAFMVLSYLLNTRESAAWLMAFLNSIGRTWFNAVAMAGLFIVLGRLARRAMTPNLARHCTAVMLLTIVSAVMLTVNGFLWSSVPITQSTVPAGVRYFALATGVVDTTVSIWAFVLLILLHRRFRLILK